MSLQNKVQQFSADADAAHQIIHGDAATVVTTAGGPVRSFAKAIADFLATGISSVTGPSLIGWSRGVPGANPTTLAKALGFLVFNVFDFMSDAMQADVRAYTYALDHTAAVSAASAAAGAGTVAWHAGGYKITSKVVQPAGQKWVGEGGQRTTTVKKFFNGDFVDMGDRGAIADINFENGATYTGKGIRVPAGFSQKIDRVRVSQMVDNCLYFAPGAGGGTCVNGFEGDTTNPGVVGAIKLDSANSGPVPIFMNGIWLSGGILDLSAPGAGNGSSMVNFYIRNILTAGPIASGSALFHMANGRCATIGDTTTLSGSDFSIANVAFSGPVALVNAQGFNLTTCTFGAGITEDVSTCNSNKFDSAVTPFTPVWNQVGGTQPSLGNGTLTGFYVRNGGECLITILLTAGSTTTFGNAASPWQISIPFLANASAGFDQHIPSAANIYGVTAATDYSAIVTIANNTGFLTMGRNGAGVRNGFPVAAPAAGDVISIQLRYATR